jgi:hypothetical protein
MRNAFFSLFLAGYFLVFIPACSKKSKEEPASPTRVLKYKILEYKTNTPLAIASANFMNCEATMFGCNPLTTLYTAYSNENGDITLNYDDLHFSANMQQFRKENYFTNTGPDTCFMTAKQDSCVIWLFPNSWLKIHLKNNKVFNPGVNLVVYTDVVVENRTDSELGNLIIRRNTILDTTLIVPTYGFATGRVESYIDSAYQKKPVFLQSKYVDKGDTASFEIVYP